MTFAGILRGVGICVFFLLSSTFSLAFVLVPSCMFRPLSRSLHRRFVSFLFGGFWTVSVYWLEALNGIKFHLSGKELGRPTDTMTIIICNHPTELDMPFFWHIAYRLGLVGDVKFVTKAAVRKVPFLGWGIHMAEYLFLKRNLQEDAGRIAKHLGSFAARDQAMWVLFPEGTDMEAYKVPLSQAYQKEHGLPIMSKVLTPKHRGLHLMLSSLRPKHPNMVIHDYTLTYNPIPKAASTIVFGQGPKECHLNVRRIPVSEVPEEEEKLKDWCIQTFVEKDRQLNYFAEHGKFDAPEIESPLRLLDALRALLFFLFFLLIDAASLWALYNFMMARLWCVMCVIGLQAWVTKFPDVSC